MSRGYEARRKDKRRQARDAAESPRQPESPRSRRLGILVPVLLIVGILAVVGALGFGSRDEKSQEQIVREVDELLDDVPQQGSILGSPDAPITAQVFADLKCPTVRLFVEKYLPGIVNTWVRTGVMRLEYRSLQTDTINESTFFKQEVAALAAGRQNKMWNFIGTFVRSQGPVRTDYVTSEFLAHTASLVPDLNMAQWRSDRKDAVLSKRVALGVYFGHNKGFESTPSFLVGLTDRGNQQSGIPNITDAQKREIRDSFQKDLDSLDKETPRDEPVLRVLGNFEREG